MCGSNKVAGQQTWTVPSTYHNTGDDLWSQASHLSETQEQRRHSIDCSLPRHCCGIQCNNGRSRSLRPEMTERHAVGLRLFKWWHRLLYFLIDRSIVNSFITWNCNNGDQRDQLSFRLALVRQLTVGREIKWRCRSDFLTKKQAALQGEPEDVRLWEAGKNLAVWSTRRRCTQCSIRKHEACTNMMWSHWKVPLCVHTYYEKFHRKYSQVIRRYWTQNACFDFLYNICLKHFTSYEELNEM